jgi:hypothetical protein
MSMNLAKENYAFNPDYLIAGNYPIQTAVKTAAEAIAAGAPVVLGADGAANVTVSEGAVVTTGLYGIAAESAEANAPVVIYLTGEFFSDALQCGTGVTAADLEVPFRNIGIFLK